MSYVPTDDHEPFRMSPVVLWLLALNVAVYFVQLTLQQDLPQTLGFSAGDWDARRLWTPLTYMFTHAGFWHLTLNMYTLWAFGPRVERSWGTPGGFLGYYLWCGLGGVAAYALLMRGGLLVGASGAVLGVLYAFARRWPNDEVLFLGMVPMKMKQLFWGMLAVNLVLGALAMNGGDGGDRVAYAAHLGGVLFGVLWFLRPSAPSVERVRQRVAAAPDVGDERPRAVPKSFPRPRERGSESDDIVEKSKALTAKPQPVRPVAPARPAPAPATMGRATALDLVLDKISEQGMSSLTSDERQLLEEMAQRLKKG